MPSIPVLFREVASAQPERPMLWTRAGDGLAARTYGEIADEVRAAAAALCDLGVRPGDKVILLSEDRPEWLVADLAVQTLGAVLVPLYPSLPANQVEPLVQRVGAALAIAEDAAQVAKLDAVRERLPKLTRILVFEGAPADHPLAGDWHALVTAGEARRDALAAELDARVAALGPDDLATILFTSGTTGVPKGVMLTHGNLLSNVEASHQLIRFVADDRMLVFLPLSHIFQRTLTYIGVKAGLSFLFSASLRHILPDMALFHPTVLIVVPRLLQTIQGRVLQTLGALDGPAGEAAAHALEVGEAWSRAYVDQREPDAELTAAWHAADEQVFRGLRARLGLDALRFMISGGAALPPELGRWYYGLGLRVAQGYGLTETSPVVGVNDPHGWMRFDSFGPPLENVEAKLAPDGELLVRGPTVMRGYYEMPDETAEVIDAEGWFHTGDLADETPEGHFRITDRKKNIMVLANGKNVAPTPIEAKLEESPLIEQAVLAGDDQNIVTALIVPAYDALYAALSAAGDAPERDAANAWVETPAAERRIRAEVQRACEPLAPFERVRKFRLLRQPLSVERGELTASLKVRRKQVLENYRELVGTMAE